MRFKIDHDLHIHTQLSACSDHPEQTPKAFEGFKDVFERAVTLLDLKETDKFIIR